MNSEPILSWHVTLPLFELPIGPALTPEQRDIEARVGVTRDILWAYADAMPELLGEAIMEDIQPLGFGRGALVAIATEKPVRLPHVQFVQTKSVDVCREMGSFVPQFHVKGRECLEALLQYGSAVKTIWVRDCKAFPVQSWIEVIFLDSTAPMPYWRERYGPDHFLRLAVFDEAAWLSWDRDERRPVIELEYETLSIRSGPRDVSPEKHPPPWAARESWALGGSGWAATMLFRESSRTEDSVFATPDRRFLLVHSFPAYPGHRAIIRAWREKKPMRPCLEGTNTWSVGVDLELGETEARYRWVGLQRVLRIRQGQIEQLTTDHDLLWQMTQTNSEYLHSIDKAQLAQFKNVVATSIGTHDFSEGICDVQPGDRFVLLSANAHERLLAAAPKNLGEVLSAGNVRDVARWAARALREEDGIMRYPALFVDNDATVTLESWYDDPNHEHPGKTARDAVTNASGFITPSVRDLVEHPEKYHGQRIRTRGIFRSLFEAMTFADAWFDCKTEFPMGSWMVEVDGIWSCDGNEYGHFGQYKAHLRGDARMISIREPRPIAPDRIQFSRPYVPLVAEVKIERRLQGFTYKDRWLHRIGADARLPAPERPDSRRARIVYANTAFHALCLFSWTWLDEPEPLVPETATAANPGKRGRFVELQGYLTMNGSNWPVLDKVLRIVPPPMSLTVDRYPLPQPEVLATLREWIGNGKMVRIVGEVGLEAKIIYALSID